MDYDPAAKELLFDFERFFNFSLDMLCIFGDDGHFKRVNPEFARTLGYNELELTSEPILGFVHPDDVDTSRAEFAHLESGQPMLSFENRYRCKDGTYRYLVWTSSPDPDTGLRYAVAHDVTKRKALEQRLLELSRTDGLTGVANRRVFDETLDREWFRACRTQTPIALALVDFDDFKGYNDTYGHLGGDECLRRVAAILPKHARRPGDLVARYGGEEFGVIWSGIDSSEARGLCESICREIETSEIPLPDRPECGRITASAGVSAMVPTKESKPRQLVAAADAALYDAKSRGRNCVVERSIL